MAAWGVNTPNLQVSIHNEVFWGGSIVAVVEVNLPPSPALMCLHPIDVMFLCRGTALVTSQ